MRGGEAVPKDGELLRAGSSSQRNRVSVAGTGSDRGVADRSKRKPPTRTRVPGNFSRLQDGKPSPRRAVANHGEVVRDGRTGSAQPAGTGGWAAAARTWRAGSVASPTQCPVAPSPCALRPVASRV